jgi:hypothetical protein
MPHIIRHTPYAIHHTPYTIRHTATLPPAVEPEGGASHIAVVDVGVVAVADRVLGRGPTVQRGAVIDPQTKAPRSSFASSACMGFVFVGVEVASRWAWGPETSRFRAFFIERQDVLIHARWPSFRLDSTLTLDLGTEKVQQNTG